MSNYVDEDIMNNFIDAVKTYRKPTYPVGFEDVNLSKDLIVAVRRTPRHLFTEPFKPGKGSNGICKPGDEEFLNEVYLAQSLIYTICLLYTSPSPRDRG